MCVRYRLWHWERTVYCCMQVLLSPRGDYLLPTIQVVVGVRCAVLHGEPYACSDLAASNLRHCTLLASALARLCVLRQLMSLHAHTTHTVRVRAHYRFPTRGCYKGPGGSPFRRRHLHLGQTTQRGPPNPTRGRRRTHTRYDPHDNQGLTHTTTAAEAKPTSMPYDGTTRSHPDRLARPASPSPARTPLPPRPLRSTAAARWRARRLSAATPAAATARSPRRPTPRRGTLAAPWRNPLPSNPAPLEGPIYGTCMHTTYPWEENPKTTTTY